MLSSGILSRRMPFVKNRHFGETYRLHLQGEETPLVRNEDIPHDGWGREPRSFETKFQTRDSRKGSSCAGLYTAMLPSTLVQSETILTSIYEMPDHNLCPNIDYAGEVFRRFT
jgi:hypothetical protein